MKKGVTITIILGVVIAALVTIYLLTNKTTNVSKDQNGRKCVSVPSSAQSWQGDMKADWGSYGRAKTQYIGVDPESLDSDFIDGFFKAIDVQPNSKYIRKYAKEIKAWLASGMADKHWNVELGELKCPNYLN